MSSSTVFGGVWGLLFPFCSHIFRLHPSNETVFDGHTCRCLSFFPPPAEGGNLGKGATSPPSPEKFAAHIRHRSKNTSVALAEFSASPGNAACCLNSSGER